jgi:hypothetical protein
MENVVVWDNGDKVSNHRYTILHKDKVLVLGDNPEDYNTMDFTIMEVDTKWMDANYKRIFSLPENVMNFVKGTM